MLPHSLSRAHQVYYKFMLDIEPDTLNTNSITIPMVFLIKSLYLINALCCQRLVSTYSVSWRQWIHVLW